MTAGDDKPRRCRYCAEDADVLLRGWFHGPPEVPDSSERRPEMEIATCRVHRLTAKLKLTSAGFGEGHQTEVDLGTWYAP